MLLKVKRGDKEEKYKVEVHKNNEGAYQLNQMAPDHSWFWTFLSYRNIQMIIIRGNRIHMKLWNETIVFTLHIFSICFNGGAFGLQSLPFGVNKYGMPVLWFIIFTLAGDKDSWFTLWQIWRFYSISHMVVIAIFFVLVLSTFHRVCSI